MIILDSCVVLDIIFDENESGKLSVKLDEFQTKGQEVVFLNLTLLESSAVVAIRYKENKCPTLPLSDYLSKLALFQPLAIHDDLSKEIIAKAAQIKASHAASMVDCYLIANAQVRQAEIITADQEILSYDVHRAKVRKITERFSGISWRV